MAIDPLFYLWERDLVSNTLRCDCVMSYLQHNAECALLYIVRTYYTNNAPRNDLKVSGLVWLGSLRHYSDLLLHGRVQLFARKSYAQDSLYCRSTYE